MPIDERLADRLRRALAHMPVEEKRMFGGLAFLVNGKMCLNVGTRGLMCRIDPAEYDGVMARAGWAPMVMRGKTLRGYAWLTADAAVGDEFDHAVSLALAFNGSAEKSARPPQSRRGKRP